MTLLGALLVGTALVGLVLRRDAVIAVALGAAAAFPQSAGIEVVQPVQVFVSVSAVAVLGALLTRTPRRLPGGFGLLAAFALFAASSAALAPWAFEGIPVLNPHAGLDDPGTKLAPLGYTVTNLTQVVIVAASVCAVVFLVRTRTATVAVPVALWTAVVTSLVRQAVRQAGPDLFAPFLDTMPGYYAVYEERWRGVFSEPSVLGGFATATVALAVVRVLTTRDMRSRTAALVLAAGAAVLVVGSGSGTGTVAMGVVAAVACVLFTAHFARSGGRGAPWYLLGVLVLTIAALTIGGTAVTAVLDLVTAKIGNHSQVSRSGADQIGLDVLVHTGGFGAGLGSVRTSSFAVALLSTVGVIGTLLFAGTVTAAVRRARRGPAGLPVVAGLLALLVAKSVALPDLGDPLLWILLAACWCVPVHQTDDPGPEDDHTGRSTVDATARTALLHARWSLAR